MKLNKQIFIVLLLSSSSIFSQKSIDEEVIDSLNDVCYDLASISPDKAIEIALYNIKKSKEVEYLDGEITAYLRAGMIYENTGNDYDTSLFYYSLAENRCLLSKSNPSHLIKIYLYQAGIYDRMGILDLALSKNHKAFELANKVKNDLYMGMALLNISTILIDLSEYSLAFKLLIKTENLLPDDEIQSHGIVHLNLGNISEIQGRYKEAIDYFEKASSKFLMINNHYLLAKSLLSIGNNYMNIEDLETALKFYNKSFNISANKFESVNGQIYNNKGVLFHRTGQLDSAQYFYEKSLQIKQNNGDSEGEMMTTQNIGEIRLINGDSQGAFDYFLLAYELAKQEKNLFQLEKLTEKMAICALDQDQIETANDYLVLSKAYKDTLAHKMNESLIYEINYNKEKHKVEELELEVQNKNLELDKNSNLIWSISSISILGFTVLFILYQLSKQRRKALQQEKENLEAKHKINELINNKEKEAMSAMYDGQEKERNRISLELHDKLGAILSTVKLYFKSIDGQINQLKAENIKQYHKASNLLDEACDETRKIAHQLSSKNLGRIGLFATVKLFQTQIQDSGQLKFTFTTHGDDSKLDGLNQTSIYRIIQELVNNIMKHAHATEINLQLNVFEDLFNLVIEDDGIGFDINNLIDNHGMGLKESEMRVKTMGGIQVIDSGRGGGTTITIDIPLNKKEK